jgi:hypothetical protein
LGLLAVLIVGVAGCTSSSQNASSASTTNNALAYAKGFATYLGKNETVKQTTIVANGTDGAQLTLMTIYTINGTKYSATSAFNIKQFSSVADATAFYNAQSFGYIQVSSNATATLDPSVYSGVMGHNPTINNAAVNLSSLTNIPLIYQQDEFVAWGTVSIGL